MILGLERYFKLVRYNDIASDIIKTKGLHFRFFFESTNSYSYNVSVSHWKGYEKLSPKEFCVLTVIVKRQYELLDSLD